MIRINGQRAQFLLAATTRSRLVDTDCLTSNEICRFHLTRSSFKCSPSADDTDDDAAAANADADADAGAWTAALTAALVAVALARSAADGRAVSFLSLCCADWKRISESIRRNIFYHLSSLYLSLIGMMKVVV